MPGYGQVDHEYGFTLATTAPADDGPIWMVNLMRYRDVAEYRDGRATQRSGREADDEYTPTESLAGVGAQLVYVADVEDRLLGDGTRWDRIGVVKYPTRQAFLAMQRRDDFRASHEHKEAGMAESIVIGCVPFDVPRAAGETAVAWDHVPHPPSDDDGPYTMMHVIAFHDEDAATRTPDHMAAYQEVAGSIAIPQGVRIDGWFAAEGTIIGDGRRWHQVRFNAFPSKRAFMAVALDHHRLEAQTEHRDAAIADTYALGLRPTLNRLAPSLDAAR